MEINDTTVSAYYTIRIFGFAPYSVTRDRFNHISDVKYSRFLCIYNILLLVILCGLTNYGLYYDTISNHPIRMKSSTSKVVTGLDVNVLVVSCLIGMLSSVFGFRNTQKLNRRLERADKNLNALYENFSINSIRAKYRTVLFVIIVYAYIGFMLALDIWGWVQIAAKLKTRDANAVSIDKNVYCFVPFYVMYVLFMTLHIKFALSTYRIGLRYRSLNNALQNSLAFEEPILWRLDAQLNHPKIQFPLKRNFIATINCGIRANPNKILPKNLDEIINRFADAHETLGRAMVNVSEEFGVTIIMLLISCLLHLVATAYFFFLEILGERDAFFTTVQMLWIIFHTGRLLLIVEPCHLVVAEAEKTIKIVCDLMRTKRDLFTLRNFWQQLMADKSYFSACGMCRIDRQLLTSISGAIATYLVILLQFHSLND